MREWGNPANVEGCDDMPILSMREEVVFEEHHMDNPERRLVREILRDAVEVITMKRKGRAGLQRAEAIEWVATTERTWIFSFTNVCTNLGLDEGHLRGRIMKLLETEDYQKRNRLAA